MKLTESILQILEYKIPDKYLDNPDAMRMIEDEIKNMVWEIEQSEAGYRKTVSMLNKEDGKGYTSYVNVSKKSSFPDYLQDIFSGKGTKKLFIASSKNKRSKYYTRIALEAINRLEKGYSNDHGYDEPSKEFIDTVNNPVPF